MVFFVIAVVYDLLYQIESKRQEMRAGGRFGVGARKDLKGICVIIEQTMKVILLTRMVKSLYICN